jgi:hypothetical protein
VSDDHGNGTQSACCGTCQNGRRPRPQLVIGVFSNAEGANGAAAKLLSNTLANVNVLSNAVPVLAHELNSLSALSLMGCGRLYQQIAHHIESGASIVVVDAHSPEQQLSISRVFLESKCDMLLTHDGRADANADQQAD